MLLRLQRLDLGKINRQHEALGVRMAARALFREQVDQTVVFGGL
jgi:hypothetical protein